MRASTARVGEGEVPRPLIVLDERSSPSHMLGILDTLVVEPKLALDTESDSFHAYRERVCLLQISAPDRDLIFDPIAHSMPRELAALLSSPDRLWILHGADYDVLSLRREWGLTLGRIFDTTIAARFLGHPSVGLKALLEQELGVVISKGEQRSDWGQRPLSESQIGYARQDTRWLLPLADRLIEALEARGRLGWALEECELLRVRPWTPKPVDENEWIQIKGARALAPPGLRALKAAWHWREEEARRTNRAPFRVLGNEVMIAIAQSIAERGLAALDGLSRTRGIPRGRDVRPLAAAIAAEVQAKEPVRPKVLPPPRPPALDAPARDRLARLRAARADWSRASSIEPGLLLPTAILESIAREPPSDLDRLHGVPGMTRWRVEAVGASILDLVVGTG